MILLIQNFRQFSNRKGKIEKKCMIIFIADQSIKSQSWLPLCESLQLFTNKFVCNILHFQTTLLSATNERDYRNYFCLLQKLLFQTDMQEKQKIFMLTN